MRVIAFLYLSFICTISFATHYVGGNINFSKLNDSTYRISTTIFRDCFGIALENPLIVNVFSYNDDNILESSTQYELYLVDFSKLETQSSEEYCASNGFSLCYEQYQFENEIVLPQNKNGYLITHINCCRNFGILNSYSESIAYATKIPGSKFTNIERNPQFNAFPPSYYCANDTAIIDQSAEGNGNTIQYSLTKPFIGELDIQNGLPKEVTYLNGYSEDKPFANNGFAEIDSSSGELKIYNTMAGRFIIGIRADEILNGKIASTTYREFQYNFESCIVKEQIEIEASTLVECPMEDSIVLKKSGSSTDFVWRINGVDTIPENPDELSFFPEISGVYTITLFANSPYLTCTDTSTAIVSLINTFDVDFSASNNECNPLSFDFSLLSEFINQNNNLETNINWEIGLNQFEHQQNFRHIFESGGNKLVGIEISLTDYPECVARVDSILEINPNYNIMAINAFSPNRDGKNEVWFPYYENYAKTASIRIFNRWGELIFETLDPYTGWDGYDYLHNRTAKMDVYVYEWIFECIPNQLETKTGNITLIR